MKRILIPMTAGLVGLLGLGTIVEPTAGGSPTAVAANVEGVCQPPDQHQYPSTTTASMTVTAPTGFLITGYCVKAGSVNQGDGPETTTFAEGQWKSSVTFSHSSGKNISHYVVYLAPIPPQPDVPAPASPPDFTPPTCDAPGSFVAKPSTEALEYSTTTENGVITISVAAKPGFVVSGAAGPWTKPVSELAQLTGDECEETTPPEDPDDVDSAGPVPPTLPPEQATRVESSPPPAAPAASSLPVTGSTSWLLSGIALATLLAGVFLTRWSRRPDEQAA